MSFLCPVQPGRRVPEHRWDGESAWAQFDLAVPDPPAGGALQPAPGLEWWEVVSVVSVFEEAERYWGDLTGQATIELPDPRWGEAFAAIVGHSALCMNDGASDVAVVNYNVFNRDGVYIASILEKAGRFELAAEAIDYFLRHPFNGRVQPEADNPGQILWVLGEHWAFTRDAAWLARVMPYVRKLAALIRYYRKTAGPHWVYERSLEFGEALPPAARKELKPGACDGVHPEYTEAFDVAGLRAAARLAEAAGEAREAEEWTSLAEDLWRRYDATFGGNLRKGYGSYCVLWPCRLYPIGEGRASEQLRGIGAQRPASWRYFPLATAHQGLLAGNREACWQTLEIHLDHPQMGGWWAFDEGGPSGVGGWNHARTTWPRGKQSVAMPHGWAVAELLLLLRDGIVFEDDDRLVLLAGIPPAWLRAADRIRIGGLPTHFGNLTIGGRKEGGRALLAVGGARPPGGFALRWPHEVPCRVEADGRQLELSEGGDIHLPPEGGEVWIELRDP